MSKDMVRSEQVLPRQAEPAVSPIEAADTARSLTQVQRRYVRAGAIHGDCAMSTVRALKRKGLFRLVIDSPNGQCGFMHLTPLGESVRAVLEERRNARA